MKTGLPRQLQEHPLLSPSIYIYAIHLLDHRFRWILQKVLLWNEMANALGLYQLLSYAVDEKNKKIKNEKKTRKMKTKRRKNFWWIQIYLIKKLFQRKQFIIQYMCICVVLRYTETSHCGAVEETGSCGELISQAVWINDIFFKR